jgi:hypothetical protein
MRSVRRSVVVVALLVTGCEFKSPGARPDDPNADAGVDAAKPPPDADPQAWLHPWARRKSITLRASQIEAPSDGSLADFPVLVSIADPQIRTGALPRGEDIVFTAGDALTVLASEIESFDSAVSDQLVAWVKVPMLSATTDTTLYVYYGHQNPPARTPEAVWTANYLAVWHLQQDPGPGANGEIRDATSGKHDGTASTPMEPNDSVRGQIGRGIEFNGLDEFLDFPSMNFGNTFTISMWVASAGGFSPRPLLANSTVGGDTDGFRFFVNSANTTDRRILFETGNGDQGSVDRAQTNQNAINMNVLTHVAAVVDRNASTARIYVNGTRADTDASIRSDFRTASDFEIARMEDSGFYFPGILDEIQVANTLRSPEWLRTSVNNQSQPGNFHTLGSEEVRP